MKRSELKQIILEEIQNLLEEKPNPKDLEFKGEYGRGINAVRFWKDKKSGKIYRDPHPNVKEVPGDTLIIANGNEIPKNIKEEINEWWTDIDGKSKKEIQDLLIKSGFDSKKVKSASDNSLATLYDIAKRKGYVKEEVLKENFVDNFLDYLGAVLKKGREKQVYKDVASENPELAAKVKKYMDSQKEMKDWIDKLLTPEEQQRLISKFDKRFGI